MTQPDIDELSGARADLLCFLVATVAASYALTKEWRVDHVVESCRIWLKRNVVKMDWLDRIRIGQLALKIARRDLKGAVIAIRQSDVQALHRRDGAESCEYRGPEDDEAVPRSLRHGGVMRQTEPLN
jgi:hypothetical protein